MVGSIGIFQNIKNLQMMKAINNLLSFKNVFVVGNLGSGKGTLINNLKSACSDILVVEERFKENSFLDLFSDDPARWGLSLQLNFLTDYINAFKELSEESEKTRVFDAGVWTNWYVFVENLRNKNMITDEEFHLYERLTKSLVDSSHYPEPDIILYVNTAPEKCLERIKSRGLEFQRETNLQYLQELHDQFLIMINDYKKRGVKIIRVDNDQYDVRNPEYIQSICKELSI